MRYLTVAEVLELHRRLVERLGGSQAVRDLAAIEGAVAEPQRAVAGKDVYATLEAKAAALCECLLLSRPLSRGNRRLAHAATAVFLALNGFDLQAPADHAEDLLHGVAAGSVPGQALEAWLRAKLVPTRLPTTFRRQASPEPAG